jgi:hypothetical protein
MLFKRLFSGLGCAAIVGCAAPPPPPAPPAPTIAVLMAGAETAIKAGKNEHAAAWLKAAIAAFPADKAPRLRMAQLQFECRNYGETITHAQQVLDRDPDDLVAHSLVAVSGLRVSSKALTDLSSKNKLSGDVRSEAQELAKLLRANIGGEIIPTIKIKTPAKPPALKPTSAPPAKPPSSSPADWLNH